MPTVPVISIVDDDVSMREAISLVLHWHGLQTETFDSAEAFLARGGHDTSACIILDVRLPGIDGLELQRRLSLTPQSPPIILISAHLDDASKGRALAAGAVGILRKPFTDDELVRTVQQALRR